MTLYTGCCPKCSYIFQVEGRRPNFCPECGNDFNFETKQVKIEKSIEIIKSTI